MFRILLANFPGYEIVEQHEGGLKEAKQHLKNWMEKGDKIAVTKNKDGTKSLWIMSEEGEDASDIFAMVKED